MVLLPFILNWLSFHFVSGMVHSFPIALIFDNSFIPKFPPPRHGALTGQKIAYIYPDFQTALTGVFVDGVMKEAQEVSESINS